MNQDTLDRLNQGDRITEVLKQPQYKPMAVEDQVLILYALSNKHLSDIAVERILKFQKDFINYVNNNAAHIMEEIRATGEISDELATEIDKAIAETKKQYNYN